MQEFQITLKNEKVPLYNRISWLIIIINLILLLYLSIFPAEKSIRTESIAILVLCAIVFAFYFYLRKTKYRFGPHVFFFVLMIEWIINDYYWFAGVVFIFDLLHMIATQIHVITITKQGITYPSVFKRSTVWQKLNNLILKDGLLTIDFKNNKVIQQPVDENKTLVDEKEFNEFCREQLNNRTIEQ